jgi:inosine/xanthosine triphosphate pyrophosphatase family protein
MAKRVIVAVTENANKLTEYKNLFSLYGISVVKGESFDSEHLHNDDYKVIAVIREESNLYKGDKVAEVSNLSVVENRSTLHVLYLHNDVPLKKEYFASIEGYIDLSKKVDSADVFGWDSIFVVKSIGLTLHELRLKGLKNSSRDKVIGAFITEFVHYDNRIDLNFAPQKQSRTVDFENNVESFVKSNKLLMNQNMGVYGLDSLLNHSLNNGLFFRSPANRREKNYWLPGLNAGIPLVPKGDDVHEITFMFHDFMHFLIPDLIFDGRDSTLHNAVYVLYRMMSEAFTLCLADMLFVDTLKKSGLEYNFTQRKVYPLFEHLNLDFEVNKLASLRSLLYANMRYALFQDDSYFRKLLIASPDSKGELALEDYKGKYNKFFVEDYKWTRNNYSSIIKRDGYISKWLDYARPLLNDKKVGNLNTITQYIGKLNIVGYSKNSVIDESEIADLIFNNLFGSMGSIISSNEKYDSYYATTSMTIRYFIGQFGLFAKFNFLPETNRYARNIIDYIKNKDVLLSDDLLTLREYFNQYVELLLEKSLISKHDFDVYIEVYPLFDPFYVFY